MPASVFKMIITALFIITIFHSAVNGKEAFDFQKECRIHFYPVEGRTFSETVNSLKVILPSRYGKGGIDSRYEPTTTADILPVCSFHKTLYGA